MGGWLTAAKQPETPIKSPLVRIANIAKNNFRGIIGFIFPIILIAVAFEKVRSTLVKITHVIFFWLLLWQPVNVPVAGLLPLFALPMFAVIESAPTCKCYFNAGAALLVLGGWVLMLWNNSGLDRRIILSILGARKESKISANSLLLKSSLAAYITCAFSNRLIATSEVMQYVTAPLLTLKGAKSRDGEPNYDNFRCVIANAIQTSGAIGSIAFIHSSYTTVGARMIYTYGVNNYTMRLDTYNFLNYSLFAIPTSILMFAVNLGYYILLMKVVVKGKLHNSTIDLIRNSFVKARGQLPKSMSLHEWMTFVFLILCLALYFTRWSGFINMGWSDYKKNALGVPLINDATVSAIFVILLHTLPRSFGFLKYLKKGLTVSELPRKPESSILFFKFVDKNTIYGYVFLIGAGVAIAKATQVAELRDAYATQAFGKFIADSGTPVKILIFVIITVISSCIMTGCGVLAVFLPYALYLPTKDATYLVVMAIGIGTSFGFTTPFLYTPAYFVKHIAKVPLRCQIKYAIGSVIICIVLLWVMLTFYGPVVLKKDSATDDGSDSGTTEAPA